jgi:two-component system OmpR family response regulator
MSLCNVAEPIPLLLVEDEPALAHEISCELMTLGYGVSIADSGTAGLEAARSEQASLVILDRNLPGIDGLSMLETLRDEGIRTPVLVVSALSSLDDRIHGLKAGGDDYLTKPFAMGELTARVEALLRRTTETRATTLRAGPIEIDLIERTARRGDRTLDLMPREFKLLAYLMRHPNQVVTRAMLLEDVWNYRFVPQTNLVDVHMGKLRRKLDAPGDEPLIQSVRGTGFLLRVEE